MSTGTAAPTKPSGIPWLGEVPALWEVKRLRFGAPLSNERVEADGEEPLPYVGMEHIESWTGKLLQLDDEFIPTGISNCMRPGQVLFGKLRPYLAKAWVADREGLCSTEFMVLDAKQYQPDFLRYLLLSEGFVRLVDSSTQGAKMPRADWEFVGDVFLPVPPLPEQRAIAAFLDERTARIDGLVARKRQLVQLLKEKRQALITRAVTRGLDPDVEMKDSGVPWLGEVPEGWEVAPLRHISDSIQTGPFGSQLHEADYIEGGIPLINPAHMVEGKIVPGFESAVDEATKERLARYVLEAGDILFARRGEIGRCALVEKHQAGWVCGTGSMRLRLVDSDPGYYAILFGSNGFAEALELNAVGTTMLNINPTILARQFVPRPPRSEQTAICEYIASTTSRIDALVTKVEKAVERLQEYRTALISAAVTGKLVLSEQNDILSTPNNI